jgi:hypothetical protein
LSIPYSLKLVRIRVLTFRLAGNHGYEGSA